MNLRTFVDQAKVFLLVSLLTVLVWMLAEAESLLSERIRVELTFRAGPETGRFVRVEHGQSFAGFVDIRVEGPTTRVDALAAQLRSRLTLEPGMDGVPLEPGRHTINLAEALRSHTLLRDSRVSIADVEPNTVTVTIDHLVTRDLPVRVEFPPGLALEGSPEIVPPSVRVHMPGSTADAIDALGVVQLIARPDPTSIANLPEGRRATLPPVQLELPEVLRGVEGIRWSPSHVTINLTPRSRTAVYTIPTVPVHLRLPPAEAALWQIQIPPESSLLTDVSVTGPSDLIDDIREGRTRPIAYITLTFEDLERAALAGEPIQAQITFSDLPTPLRFEARQRTIAVTVRRRENGDSPADPGVP